MTDIFISRPTWVPPEYEAGLTGFIGIITDLELVPRTLGVTDYPAQSPLDEVVRIMTDCSGAIILGVPQIRASEGTIKDAAICEPLTLGTEWNHIEAGIAFASGLPLLIIHHNGVTRGVFDRGTTSRYIYEVDMARDAWPLADEIRGAIRTWRASLRPANIAVEPAEAGVAARDDLSDEEVAILQLLAEGDGQSLVADQIGRMLNIRGQRLQFFLERLTNEEFVYFPLIMNVEPSYELDQNGREYLMRRQLL